jgi:hypothetical protein
LQLLAGFATPDGSVSIDSLAIYGYAMGALTAFFVARYVLVDAVCRALQTNATEYTSDSEASSSPWQVLWASTEESNTSSTTANYRYYWYMYTYCYCCTIRIELDFVSAFKVQGQIRTRIPALLE